MRKVIEVTSESGHVSVKAPSTNGPDDPQTYEIRVEGPDGYHALVVVNEAELSELAELIIEIIETANKRDW